MRHSLFRFRPTRHLALGLGAAGIALGSGGLAVAATALIQPAGALSVQVPAVAVREQNVNAAGRIRVALPKAGVGVNGSVSVNNLPENSAGQMQTASNLNQTSHEIEWGTGNITSTPQTALNVSGAGVFDGFEVATGSQSALVVSVKIDGNTVFYDGTNGAGCCLGGSTPVWGSNSPSEMYFYPRIGLPFEHSLVVTIALNYGPATGANGRFWYQTQT